MVGGDDDSYRRIAGLACVHSGLLEQASGLLVLAEGGHGAPEAVEDPREFSGASEDR